MELKLIVVCVLSLLVSCGESRSNRNVIGDDSVKDELSIELKDYKIVDSNEMLINSGDKKDFAKINFVTSFPVGAKVIIRKQLFANTVNEDVLKESFLVDTIVVSNEEIQVSLSHKFIPSFIVFDVYGKMQNRELEKLMQEKKNRDYHCEFLVDYNKKKIGGFNSGEVLLPLGLYIK